MMKSSEISNYSRSEFIQLCARGVGAFTLLCTFPKEGTAQTAPPVGQAKIRNGDSFSMDLREFVHWILSEYEPSIRLAGGAGMYPRQPGQTSPALYGVSDMACTLYTIGALHPSAKERAEWADAFELFQNPNTGWFLEKEPKTLSPQHNTAFALAAMQLLDLNPLYPVKADAQYSDIRAYLNSLNWHTGVYQESHKGAGIGSIYALVPALGTPKWFGEYFATCDSLFDSYNGLMGLGKPKSGDTDQIGGTFHYSFLYEFFNRQMPYPEKRIDTVLGLQRSDGYWLLDNPLWMTLDAIYLMTRTLRYCPHRFEEVRASVQRSLRILEQDIYSSDGRKKTFAKPGGVHLLTAAINIAAEAQQFLGIQEVITDWPLKIVLDRRPFI
jgi:hypothetical protein